MIYNYDEWVTNQNDVLIENEYNEFISFINNNNINEIKLSIPSSIKKKLNFVKELANNLKTDLSNVLALFKNKHVFKFFSLFKFSVQKIFEFIKKGFDGYKKLINVIAEYVASTKVHDWTKDKIEQLNTFLQEHPKLKRLGGVTVGGLLVYIWLNAISFTGDVDFDFNLKVVFDAVLGNYDLVSIFAGPDGIKLLLFIVTNQLFGLSFPWPGPSSIQFISAILYTIAIEAKVHKKYTDKIKKYLP